MNNFFCGLHYVVGLADCAEETLKVWEANASEEGNTSGSSGTSEAHTYSMQSFPSQGVPTMWCFNSLSCLHAEARCA